MPGLMIQGTGSNVGKSLVVAGLCRALRLRGLSVAPFKPQNMSNNAAVTADGGEIGRAQALQARAAGLAPHSDMNPVLLKPESETGSQVIVQGRRIGTFKARDYWRRKAGLMDAVMDSYRRLEAAHDLVVIEGAGSAAEVNLRAHDIANMGFAEATGVPVILLGDIDRGGVIAQIVGTKAVIEPADAARIHGFIINRFRGDLDLFSEGHDLIETRTGWPGMGILPAFDRAHLLPAEDAQDIRSRSTGEGITVAWLVLSRVANFDDLDPLAAEPGVRLLPVHPGQPIPPNADLVIVPGTKSTRSDLAFLRAQGWDIDLLAHHRRGGRILGICGGYQMLGLGIADPWGIEGPPGRVEGLGLLQVETVMEGDKTLRQVRAAHEASASAMTGYEIHMGRTDGPDCRRPFARVDGRAEGAISADGLVQGTYLHGLFCGDGFRRAWLGAMGAGSDLNHGAQVEQVLDELAGLIETHLDLDRMLALAFGREKRPPSAG